MNDETRFLLRLRQEIDRWQEEGLLDTDTLQILRNRYGFVNPDGTPHPQADSPHTQVEHHNPWIRWVFYLAVFAFLAAFFSFAGSRATSLGASTRIGVLLAASIASIAFGTWIYPRRRIEGIALFILSGLLLPITFYFLVHYYHLWNPPQPFLWWTALGTLLTAAYLPLAYRLKEEGLAGAALLCASSIPFLLTVHFRPPLAAYPFLCVGLAFTCWLLAPLLNNTWRTFLLRPLWLHSHLLAATALTFPITSKRFHFASTSLTYLLTALFYLLQSRRSQSPRSIAPFIVALIGAVGSALQAGQIHLGFYPLVQLLVSTTVVALALSLFRTQRETRDVLLSTLLLIVLSSTIGLFFLRTKHFPSPSIAQLTTAGYLLFSLAGYLLAWRQRRSHPVLLAHLAGWHLLAALIFALLTTKPSLEVYSLTCGTLLSLNALLFAKPEHRDALLTLAICIFALPSLILSWFDTHLLRTLLLSLAGITMIGAGTAKQQPRILTLGIFTLLPAIALKLIPSLSSLGIPKFLWFALFGILLAAIAFFLQRKPSS